jgi:hypothetical protein
VSDSRELPAVDFSSFIVSLASSAMASLGQGSDPRVDLAMARHSIDLLLLLEKKTIGNLDDEEKKLLETVLYETQVRFVEAQKKA